MKTKKKDIKSDWNLRNILLSLSIVLIIILVFTFFDYLIHLLSEEYAVPSYYFKNKVIFGTIIGFLVYLFTKKTKPFKRALIFSTIVSVLLQIRYAIEGFSLEFVIEFLFIHFGILLVVSWITFRLVPKSIFNLYS